MGVLYSMANVSFVRLTITKYIEKLNNGTLDENTLYFVSTNLTDDNDLDLPYLLYVGSNLIGSSGALVRYATDGLITLSNTTVEITNPQALSTNIQGMPGQTLFIINKNSETGSINTYLYFWDSTTTSTFGNINITGAWVNANITYVSTISLGDLDISKEDLRKLKELLV